MVEVTKAIAAQSRRRQSIGEIPSGADRDEVPESLEEELRAFAEARAEVEKSFADPDKAMEAFIELVAAPDKAEDPTIVEALKPPAEPAEPPKPPEEQGGKGEPKDAEPRSSEPPSYLASWREILITLGFKNNQEERLKVARLNKTYAGPIIIPGQGKQPFVEKAALLNWWGDLEAKVQAEQDRQRDAKATVAAQYNYASEGKVVPDIAGGVKTRRRGRKP